MTARGTWWPGAHASVPREWEEQEQDEGRLVMIRLRGEIDLQKAPQLRAMLRRHLARKVPAVLLDFSLVKYIDSSGLATLVEYYQHSRSFGGQLALAGATERVKNIFDLVRLREIFSFYSSVEQARLGLSSSP